MFGVVENVAKTRMKFGAERWLASVRRMRLVKTEPDKKDAKHFAAFYFSSVSGNSPFSAQRNPPKTA